MGWACVRVGDPFHKEVCGVFGPESVVLHQHDSVVEVGVEVRARHCHRLQGGNMVS